MRVAAALLLLLAMSGCIDAPDNEVEPGGGAIVGRRAGYAVREFKFDNGVVCYTNGNSISCLVVP